MTSSSSSLSSSGWREKLLQQQSSVCRDGPEAKLTPGRAEHILSNAGNGMWMGIPKRNPHTAGNVTDDSETSSSDSSASGCCFCSAEDPWLLEKDPMLSPLSQYFTLPRTPEFHQVSFDFSS